MDSSYGNWSAAYQKAFAFVEQLTLAEKVNLTTGSGWQLEACVGNTGQVSVYFGKSRGQDHY